LINSNLFFYKLLLNYRSFKAIADCSPGSSSSRTARHHTPRSTQKWLRTNCPDFITKKSVVFKFAGYKPTGLSHVGCNVGGLPQSYTAKLKTIAEVKEALQVIWGNWQLPQGPTDKAVKNFSN